MIRLEMKNCNLILKQSLQKYYPHHYVKLIIMNILQAQKYYFTIKAEQQYVAQLKLSLNNCNCTRNGNHSVHRQTLNHLAKLAKSVKLYISRLFQATGFLTFRQQQSVDSLSGFTRTSHDKNTQLSLVYLFIFRKANKSNQRPRKKTS